jgi:hypothetical protein
MTTRREVLKTATVVVASTTLGTLANYCFGWSHWMASHLQKWADHTILAAMGGLH